MKGTKRILALLLCILMLFASMPFGKVRAAAIKGKTGIGMAEWALRAYNEGWSYVYGGSKEGSVDCSGLIRSYCDGKGGGAKALLDASSSSGKISSLPRVHGLGLWCEGHAGVYVGKNEDGTDMVVDARNSKVNVVYSSLKSRSWSPWVKWFKISMVSYPKNGWFDFNGGRYYYENGEFVVGVHTVDGVSYDFGKSGALKGKAAPTTTTSKTAATTLTTTTTTTTRKTTLSTSKSTTEKTTAKTTTTKKTTETTSSTKASTTKKTTAKTTSGYKRLALGMSGDNVVTLQQRLIELGYLGTEADGNYGSQTQAAVELFQIRAGLDPDGVAGPATQKALYSDDAPTYSRKTTTSKTTTTTETTKTTKKTTAPTEPEEEPTPPEEQENTSEFIRLEVGSIGDEVLALEARLREKGFYDQPDSDYYGSFVRDAVKAFQRYMAIDVTGVADEYTQQLLYYGVDEVSESDFFVIGDEFGDEYFELGGDLYDELGVEATGIELADSQGLSGFSKKAAPESYMSKRGDRGTLVTLGIASKEVQSFVLEHNGTKFVIDEITMDKIDECIFN